MNVFLQQMARNLDRLGVGRRAQIALAGGVALAIVFGVYRLGTGPNWVPLVGPTDFVTVSTITNKLDEEGIPNRHVKGGSEIQVPAADLAKARIALAQEGLTQAGRPGLELFDRPQWGMTDFTQRVNYRRALEGELERTISEMTGVESAKVHLALQESSVFRRASEPAEASVVLSLRPGADAGDGIVRGITFLVASSVDRLSSEHVTVLDAFGRVLSASTESNGGAGLTSRQMEAQLNVEGHLETKARRLLDPVVGVGNADVRVSATLNFDQLARTVQSVDPDAQVLMEEERAEVIPGANSTGAASAQSKTTFDGTRSVEQFTQGQGGVQRLTVAVLVNAQSQTDAAGNVTFTDRTQDELDRIEDLVANAVGIDATRGDAISVVSVPFNATPTIMPPVGGGSVILDWVQALYRPILSLIALVLAFVLALRALRTLRDTPTVLPQVLQDQLDAANNVAEAPAAPALPTRPSREQLAARIVGDPQAATRVANAMLSEA